MKHLLLTIPVIAALAMPAAYAGPRMLTGEVSSERASELTTEMPWYHSLSQAEATAQRERKLIFWVQMLGSLDGAT